MARPSGLVRMQEGRSLWGRPFSFPAGVGCVPGPAQASLGGLKGAPGVRYSGSREGHG
jgi:hypothetical protein